jgi:hypothetical protein
MNRCPPLEVLEQLLVDTLAAAVREDTENHLGICAGCQKTWQNLTGGTDETWRRLSAAPAQATALPFLDELKKRPPFDRLPSPDILTTRSIQ